MENYYPVIGPRYVGTGRSKEEGINIIRLKAYDRIKIFTRLLGLRKILKELKPDLIICHGFEVGLLPVQSCIRNVSLIVDSHFLDVYRRNVKMNPLKIVKRTFYRFIYFFYGIYLKIHKVSFFGVTEESVKNISKLGFIPHNKISLIPLGVSLNSYYKSDDLRSGIRKELGISKDDIVLIYSGKIEEYKGVHLIIEAMKLLRELKLWLIIVGNGSAEYKKCLNGLARSYNISERIISFPFADKALLNKYFNCADIGVYPLDVTISHIEAMAVGLPIIIEDLPGLKHRVSNNNGFLLKDGNIKQLSQIINELSLDHDKRMIMGNNAVELVDKSFKWESISNSIILLSK